ncbi:head-tail joining protein [Comamonas sp. 23]|uniref:head-tail joining protein n=1 Tax=Comamonas sp. 23 TaxID=3415008 RepID=UPI003C703125
MVASVAPFVAIQQRANAAVMQRLANAVARVDGGEPFGVIFESPYGDAFGGDVDSRSPQCKGSAEMLGSLQRGDAILIDSISYRVQDVEPDGAGLVMVRLIQEGD